MRVLACLRAKVTSPEDPKPLDALAANCLQRCADLDSKLLIAGASGPWHAQHGQRDTNVLFYHGEVCRRCLRAPVRPNTATCPARALPTPERARLRHDTAE